MFALIGLLVLLFGLYYITKGYETIHKFINDTLKGLVWNSIIEAFNQSYMNNVFKSMVSLKYLLRGQSTLSEESLSLIIFVACLVGTYLAGRFFKNLTPYELKKEEYLEKFGSGYTDLRFFWSSPPEVLWWRQIFLLNRLVFCLVATVIFTSFAWLQITIMVYCQLGVCCYLVAVQPYDNLWMNRLEIIN